MVHVHGRVPCQRRHHRCRTTCRQPPGSRASNKRHAYHLRRTFGRLCLYRTVVPPVAPHLHYRPPTRTEADWQIWDPEKVHLTLAKGSASALHCQLLLSSAGSAAAVPSFCHLGDFTPTSTADRSSALPIRSKPPTNSSPFHTLTPSAPTDSQRSNFAFPLAGNRLHRLHVDCQKLAPPTSRLATLWYLTCPNHPSSSTNRRARGHTASWRQIQQCVECLLMFSSRCANLTSFPDEHLPVCAATVSSERNAEE